MPRILCPIGSIASICAVSRSPGLGSLDCLNVLLEHDMMHCLLELDASWSMPADDNDSLGATGSPKLMRGAVRAPLEVCPHQIAHCPMPRMGDPHRGQFTCPVQSRQSDRMSPIRLHPVARPFRISDGYTMHSCPRADNWRWMP
jgi:hypothetical protein